MSEKVMIVCPHCGSTSIYEHGFSSGSGSTGFQCKQCRKHFEIHVTNGEIDSVRK